MKKLFLLIIVALVALLPFEAEAQCKFESVSISAGRSALSSGLEASAGMTCGDRTLGLVAGQEQLYATYGIQLPLGLKVSASGGFFQNTPWVGPLIEVSQGPLFLMTWFGASAGEVGQPEADMRFMYHFNGVYLSHGGLNVGYAYMTFQGGEVFRLPGASFGVDVGPAVLRIGADYNLGTKEPLFSTKLTLKL